MRIAATRTTTATLGLAILCLAVNTSTEATAQGYRRAPRASTAPRAPGARGIRGYDNRRISKPHANKVRTPTISPYLNLLRNGSGSIGGNYLTLVRPQLNQRRLNISQSRATDRQRRELQQINRQIASFQEVQQLRSQSALQQQTPARLRPTGHGVTFMNRSHFYPSR